MPSTKLVSVDKSSLIEVKKPKINYRGIHAKVVDAMLGIKSRLPPFPAKLHRWVDFEGNSIIYVENKNGIVRSVANDHVHALIAEYWDTVLENSDDYWGAMSAEDATKIRKLWLARSVAREKSWRPLGFASTKDLCLHKVAFDPCPDIGTDIKGMLPLYEDLMNRMTDHWTFMAWIGSLFDPDSQKQQYAWIHGAGMDGKGSILRAIMKVLGPVASNENPPTKDAKHWTFGLKNKRLVVFADCTNTHFITSGDFRTLTGEDGIRIEPKGKASYTETLHAKFLISSNERPVVSSIKADLRRFLFFNMSPIKELAGSDYEQLLEKETELFLIICWNVYQETTKGNPRVMLKCDNDKEIQKVVDDSEHEMESFALGYINYVESEPNTPDVAKKYVEAHKMNELMERNGFKTEYHRKKLRDFLERKYGIVCKRVMYRSDNKVRRVFLNCQLVISPLYSKTEEK